MVDEETFVVEGRFALSAGMLLKVLKRELIGLIN